MQAYLTGTDWQSVLQFAANVSVKNLENKKWAASLPLIGNKEIILGFHLHSKYKQMNPILNLDAIGQAELIKKGDISPAELVQAAIDQVEALNPTLNAVITPMYEQALEIAKKDLPDAPFKGVPMLMKDGVASVKGARMTSGSALFKNYIGKEDSTLVKRLKKAGFIIIGKANLPEFGLLPTTEPTAFGASRNPWDTSRTTGGSSGGSSAAVAARMVAVAHANDGGGSIRIPASCCGLFGLKPTRGRNPLGPFGELVSGLVAEHVVTRSVRDSAAVLDVTAGDEMGTFYCAPPKNGSYLAGLDKKPRKLKIGFITTTPMGGKVHQDCVEATLKAVQLCKGLGHEVREMPLNLPFTGKQLGEIFGVIWAVAATSPLALIKKITRQEPPKELVEPLTWALYQQGQKVSGADYELARQAMQKVGRSINFAFQDIDIWLSPTLGMPPVPIGSFAQDENNPLAPMKMASAFSPMTAIFNISGQPAASVPLHWNKENLPIGVQLVGKFGDEHTVFQLSQQMEEAVQWGKKSPFDIKN